MAKNKKSKILASMLAVSTMAVFYAAPVMAAEFTLDSNSSVTTETTTSTGGYTQNEVRVNISDGISSDTIGTFYSNEEEAGFKTDYTMTASTFTLEAGGRTWALLTVDGLTYTNRNTLNNVSLTADGLTFSNLNNPEDAAVLNAAAINSWNEKTQNINAKDTVAGKTRFDGKVIADKFGAYNNSFYVDENSTIKGNSLIIGKNGDNAVFKVDRNGAVKAANGAFTVDKDGNVTSKLINGVNVSAIGTNTAGITRENVTKNITKTNIENSYITSAGELYINKANGQTNFSVDKYGNANVRNNLIANGISVNNDRFTVAKDGTVKSESDFITTDKAGNQKYSLNAVGADLEKLTGNVGNIGGNVAGISRNDADLPYGDGRTEIEGVVVVNGKDGRFYVLGENGTQAAVITNDGTARFGFENEKHVRLEDGALKINDADKNTVASLSDEGLTLGAENLDEAQLNNINNVIQEGGNVVANSVNVGDGAVMANSDGSFSAANNAFKVDTNGTLTISNAAFPLEDKTVIGAGYIDIGATHIDGFGIETDYIEAGSGNIGGVSIVNGEVDGVDISDLNTTVTSNLSGIDRIDSDNDGDLDTTIIEGALSANTSTVNMFGDTGLDFTYGQVPNGEAGVNVTGNMHFMSGADVTFNYDGTKYENKSYSLNDLVDGINDLNGRVDVLEEKTQGISYDEETGTTTVDGNLNVEGDATTGEGGNLNAGAGNFDKVSTDEITVGDKTYIDGDSVNSVEGNFENITADKGNIGGVGLENGTVTADKVVTGNTTLDNEGLNVGGQTSVTADGVNVGGAEGTSIKHDEITVGDGGYIGGGDVVSGEGTSLNNVGDRVGNLEQGVSELNNRVGELEDRIDKVGAMAAAIANLRTMGYDPAAPTEVAVGIGQYRDETGAALGLFHYPNRDFMLSLSVSTSGDEVMGGIGATWKFGRKSPEKVAEIKKAQAEADVRRAEEAKLAKAEEMKQAAKEAKIKAQQERHAKLAAERAAQAEAAK